MMFPFKPFAVIILGLAQKGIHAFADQLRNIHIRFVFFRFHDSQYGDAQNTHPDYTHIGKPCHTRYSFGDYAWNQCRFHCILHTGCFFQCSADFWQYRVDSFQAGLFPGLLYSGCCNYCVSWDWITVLNTPHSSASSALQIGIVAAIRIINSQFDWYPIGVDYAVIK